jgi:endonuclease/exonuclease/phosphatase family metal-dependent hydrolase
MCFITCNIRFDNPADGENSWPHRREFLVETLLRHSPDVIATQEGRYAQLLNMAELLPDFDLIDSHRSWIKERMYPSFFVRRDKFEVLKSEDLWLSETPEVAGSLSFDSTFPRLFTWVKLQPRGSESSFLVVNTHLDHIRSHTRLCQVRVLGKEIKRFWKEDSSLIIMGDFNDSPESEVRTALKEEFKDLQDPWKSFNNVEETSHHSFKGKIENGARIDWIMVDRALKVESCFLDKTDRQGYFPSDHFPVICKFSS